MTSPAGYGASASAINSSLTSGPYESAVSMKFTPFATACRNTFFAASRSAGQPQMPLPTMRIAPKPIRLTVRSPPIVSVPAAAAGLVDGAVMVLLFSKLHTRGRVCRSA